VAKIPGRAAAIAAWIKEKYHGTADTQLRTIEVAEQASADLGFVVKPRQIANQFYKQSIQFRKSPQDPPPPAYSTQQLLRLRVDYLESRIADLEVAQFGTARSKTVPVRTTKGKA
jgi:hypothetical protein